MPQLLPNGKQTFFYQNGSPLANGSVAFYLPNTTTPATTWADPGSQTPNPNPVPLDANGQAIIYGNGAYRQIVKDANGVTIWDQQTAAAAGYADLSANGATNPGASLVGFDGGTLATSLLSKINRIVDSISALRGLSKATYNRAFVTGYYAAHDGGGGAYQYDPNDTTSTDNGGTIIVASDGGRWKLQYTGPISLKQFGCKIDGATDDTTAIQAAVTALASGDLYHPGGTCVISSINITTALKLIGAGPKSSIIKTNSATLDVLNCTGVGIVIEKIGFDTSVTRTAGAFVRFQSACSQVTLRDFAMSNYFVGIRDTSAAASRIQDGYMFGPATAPGAGSAGILVDGGNDTYINQVTMDAPAAQQPAAGIQVTQTGALNITDCDIIHHTADLLINPGNGQSVASVYAVNSYFDTAVRGVSIAPTGNGVVIRLHFIGCWTSSHTDSGFFVQSSSTGALDGIEITNHHAILCAANGMLFNNGTTNPSGITILGGDFAGNGQNGIAFGAGVLNFSVIGAHSGAYAGQAGNGQWGILIAAGASNQYVIQGCHLLGNTSGTISDGGTGSTKFIENNIGVTGVQTVPTVGASPWTYTNSTARHQTAYINGGTVSIVAVNGSNIFTQTNCTARIPPGQSMTITYSSAPGVGITTDA
ncbi:glycosyl hydrolase family 28-related protein [Ralstonia thomasii]|jgi:hypothetical protein|uniref:Rhamnogalacturonase A/B/Epimerase-like pectate lyase domain-containing protein n=2 Tax=Ralstonia TaxID=48736 RepID=A0ABN9JBY3_9RALS|nr:MULTISPECIES: glycosyl hydrolase family 28-related protein [Ralstonia]MBT2181005.1 hypothetical protein [Ralstonia pickettii]CAJ0710722.1 hypothetical protein LMG7143_01704 [Ralstonia sp. LMG 18095]CAJ0806204.1 hypothetical protein LMG18095_04401 [Ralstonia sp. LMG 18095]